MKTGKADFPQPNILKQKAHQMGGGVKTRQNRDPPQRASNPPVGDDHNFRGSCGENDPNATSGVPAQESCTRKARL